MRWLLVLHPSCRNNLRLLLLPLPVSGMRVVRKSASIAVKNMPSQTIAALSPASCASPLLTGPFGDATARCLWHWRLRRAEDRIFYFVVKISRRAGQSG